MGTRVEYGMNVLAPSSTKRSKRFSVDDTSESEYESQTLNHSFQITGLDKYQSSTKMPQHKHNIDFIKNTMQLHDHIFKQQVKELHRLYHVQKMLMEEMEKSNHKRHSSNEKRRPREEGETERSGSCSNDIQTMKMIKTSTGSKRGFDLERKTTTDQEDVSTGVISRIDGAVEEEEAEIELTLSIGRRSRTKKVKNEQQQDSSTPTSTKHPHWLFHGFTINRTSSSSTG